MAAHAVVGEKQARTLEPLLATPYRTLELLLAKVIGALVPTLVIAMAGLAFYVAGIALFAVPGVLGAMINLRTAVLVLLLGPASALLSLQAAILISSRVNDARTAQQFGVFIVIPISALLVAQFTGALWLSAFALTAIAAGHRAHLGDPRSSQRQAVRSRDDTDAVEIAGSRCWVQGAGCRVRVPGDSCWVLGAGCLGPGAGCFVLGTAGAECHVARPGD